MPLLESIVNTVLSPHQGSSIKIALHKLGELLHTVLAKFMH